MPKDDGEDASSAQTREPPRTVRPSFELEGVLNSLIDLSKRVIDSDSCGIFGLVEGEGGLELLTTRDTSPSFEQQVHRFNETGRLVGALGSDTPTVVSDGEGGEAGRSFVVAPMVVQDRPLGAFVLCCDRARGDYTPGELDLIAILSGQAALALENARLYQNLNETHRKLKASQAQLVQSGKMAAVGQLAAGVAHEVNNPLQIILSRVQLMMMRHQEEERLSKDLQLVESNVKRISRIIRSLLDFARHNSGEEEWKTVDLSYLVTQTTNLMQHLMDKVGIEVSVSQDPDGIPCLIYANVGEIEQVFLNLLINAQQAMPAGGRVDIELSSDGRTTTARIRDTGEGIPSENLSRIFDPFFTTREEEGGSGLGLSIIYGIVEKHNGEIEVESEPGAWTSFTLRFHVDDSVGPDGPEA